MSMNDNIIITPTGVAIKDYNKEISKTQKSIKKLKKEYEEFLPSFQKAKENFCNKFGIAKPNENIVTDCEEFHIMKDLAQENDDFCAIIKWETTSLESLRKNNKN